MAVEHYPDKISRRKLGKEWNENIKSNFLSIDGYWGMLLFRALAQ